MWFALKNPSSDVNDGLQNYWPAPTFLSLDKSHPAIPSSLSKVEILPD